MKLLFFSSIKGPDLYLPLNLLTLATHAQALGHEARVVDGQIEVDWLTACTELAQDADILCVSSYTGPSIAAPAKLVRSLRESGWDRIVVWGGYHATLAGDNIIRDGLADIAVRGSGEYALAGILEWLTGRREIDDIPNLIYPEGDTIRRANPASINYLDELSPVDYRFVPVESYYTPQRRIVHFISSYGCPYACTFCAEPQHSSRRWRGLSPERLCSDMSRVQETYAPDRISLVDPNFSTQPARVVGFVEEVERHRPNLQINCNMRARDVLMVSDRMDLSRLYEAGFRRIFIGVESGSDASLKMLKKASTADEHYRAVTALDRHGIEVQASFIHDLPFEEPADAQATLDLAERLLEVRTPGSSQSHHFYMPYPGTELGTASKINLRDIPTEEWARSSTFRANEIWRGRADRRQVVIDRLSWLHERNPAVISSKDLNRLTDSAEPEHDYVERFML